MLFYRVDSEVQAEEFVDEFAKKYACNRGEIKYKITENANPKIFFLEIFDCDASSDDIKEKKSVVSKFDIMFEQDGIYVIVKEDGQEVNGISEKLISLDIYTFAYDKIVEAIEKINTKTKVAECDERYLKAPDILVHIEQDGMKALVKLSKVGNYGLLTKEYIISILNENGVIFGIKEEIIDDIIKNRRSNEYIIIAEGKDSTPGRDAIVLMNAEPFTKKKTVAPKIDENGVADYKNLDLFQTVNMGDVIAEKEPATDGENGSSVTGTIIEARPGKEILLRPGKNCNTSDDGRQLIAEANGMVVIEQDKVSVTDMFTVDNVGVNSGNINFNGSVIVKQNVEAGYIIESGGNVQINGNVERSKIKSTGDIFVKGGIIGYYLDGIEAGNNLICKFAENSVINTSGNISVGEELLNCKILCGGRVAAEGKKGQIIGGETVAAEGIDVLSLGSNSEIKTFVEVGNNPLLVKEIERKEKEVAELRHKLLEIERTVTYLEDIKNYAEYKFTPENEERLKTLEKMKFSMSYYVTEAELSLAQYRIEEGTNKDAVVRVRNVCYPGVVIQIRDRKYKVTEKMTNVIFYFDDDSVKDKHG